MPLLAATAPLTRVLSDFRAALLAYRAEVWARWATGGMAAEQADFDRAVRAGEPVTLSAHTVFMVLHGMGDTRWSLFAWGACGYDRDWNLTDTDELIPAEVLPCQANPDTVEMTEHEAVASPRPHRELPPRVLGYGEEAKRRAHLGAVAEHHGMEGRR